MKTIFLNETELKMLKRALREAQIYSLNKAKENKEPQSVDRYVAELQVLLNNIGA